MQQFLVAAGAASALVLHALLRLASNRASAKLSWSLGSLAVVVQAALGFQALLHLWQADRNRPVPQCSAPSSAVGDRSEDAARRSEDETRETNWLGSFKAYDPRAYGAVEQGAARARGGNPFEAELGSRELSEATEARLCSATGFLASFGVPFACVFTAECGDRSVEALLAVDSASARFVAMGGCTLAIVVAAMLGFVLERQLSERRVLFAVALGLWSLWIMAASQDIVQLYGTYVFNRRDSALIPAVALAEAHAPVRATASPLAALRAPATKH